MINIKELAKKWLTEHEHYEHEPTFEGDLSSLLAMIDDIRNNEGYVVEGGDGELIYDSSFGDDRLCECTHAYYRHFDTYDDMAPVGCKYCCHWSPIVEQDEEYHSEGYCTGFKEKKD